MSRGAATVASGNSAISGSQKTSYLNRKWKRPCKKLLEKNNPMKAGGKRKGRANVQTDLDLKVHDSIQ